MIRKESLLIFGFVASALMNYATALADAPDYSLRTYEYEHRYNNQVRSIGSGYGNEDLDSGQSFSSGSPVSGRQTVFKGNFGESIDGILSGGQALLDSAKEAELDSASIQAHMKRAEIFLMQRRRESAVYDAGRLIAMSPQSCWYYFQISEPMIEGLRDSNLSGYIRIKGLSCAERENTGLYKVISLNKK